MPSLRRPKAIRPGARIAIVAPAGPVDPEALDAGRRALERLGFDPVCRDDILERDGYLAGSDARRADELMQHVRDPDVDAILCARGGYGCHRIVEALDPETFRAAAKPLIGYSDVTTLLLWQRRRAGLLGIHGPMLERRSPLEGEAASALVRLLQGAGPLPRYTGETIAPGWAEGRLVGGSLTVCVASLGTPWEIDTRDAILMLEDVTELPYRVDRMLQQLRAAGKLERVAGIALGAFTDCEDERYPEIGCGRLFEELFLPLGVPVVAGLPFGHVPDNRPWVFGGRAALDGARGELELLESAVTTR
ncbi:MAG: LD-carboxypeptidase [Deltaproteobacteria bacterium]|jgi:muramoyltetrapeptide carboxypeptidase|nr:LD-carboxypeptidase [Deltaproteobacteria bacterium]MBW2498443.1 LD-carboxypeptidase [Deltaproteobacteria bacterium]